MGIDTRSDLRRPIYRRRRDALTGGLIFGFATVNEPAIAEGVEILARVIGR